MRIFLLDVTIHGILEIFLFEIVCILYKIICISSEAIIDL